MEQKTLEQLEKEKAEFVNNNINDKKVNMKNLLSII